jgi:hypothetical protein
VDQTNFMSKAHGRCIGCGLTCDPATDRAEHKTARACWKDLDDAVVVSTLEHFFAPLKDGGSDGTDRHSYLASVMALIRRLPAKKLRKYRARLFQCYGCNQTTWCHSCLSKEENCKALAPYCFIGRYGTTKSPKMWVPLIICSKRCWHTYQTTYANQAISLEFKGHFGVSKNLGAAINAFNAQRLKDLPEVPLRQRP